MMNRLKAQWREILLGVLMGSAIMFLVLWVGTSYGASVPVLAEDGTTTKGGVTQPLFVIKIGDLTAHEARSAKFARMFGPFSLDGIIITRFPDNQALWYGVLWKMPKTTEEVEEFVTEFLQTKSDFTKSSFYRPSKPAVASEILPAFLGRLLSEDLKKVYAIALFSDGAARVILESGTTKEEAEQLLAQLM